MNNEFSQVWENKKAKFRTTFNVCIDCGKSRVKSQRGKVTGLILTFISSSHEFIQNTVISLMREFHMQFSLLICLKVTSLVKLGCNLSHFKYYTIHVSFQEQSCLEESQSSPVNQTLNQNWNNCIYIYICLTFRLRFIKCTLFLSVAFIKSNQWKLKQICRNIS